MAKKYTISLTDEVSNPFSLELYKSKLLQDLLSTYYDSHQPNEYIASVLIESGHVNKENLVSSAANVASVVSFAKDVEKTPGFIPKSYSARKKK